MTFIPRRQTGRHVAGIGILEQAGEPHPFRASGMLRMICRLRAEKFRV